MRDHPVYEAIHRVAQVMFDESYLGIHHGSLSARLDHASFVINRREAMFGALGEEDWIGLECGVEDYRRASASIDAPIHEAIYRRMPQAKFVAHTVPPYVGAWALEHDRLTPRDYFGATLLGEVEVYDPGAFEDWHRRAPSEIAEYLGARERSIMVIRGYGVYVLGRDAAAMAKRVAVLEASARWVMLAS